MEDLEQSTLEGGRLQLLFHNSINEQAIPENCQIGECEHQSLCESGENGIRTGLRNQKIAFRRNQS